MKRGKKGEREERWKERRVSGKAERERERVKEEQVGRGREGGTAIASEKGEAALPSPTRHIYPPDDWHSTRARGAALSAFLFFQGLFSSSRPCALREPRRMEERCVVLLHAGSVLS